MQAHRRYPDAARQRGEEGTAGVAFTVSRDGSVLAVQVVRSSGSTLLDQAVHDMLAGQKVPAFPAGMTGTQAQVVVNVRFSLDR
jgi:protein TonB